MFLSDAVTELSGVGLDRWSDGSVGFCGVRNVFNHSPRYWLKMVMSRIMTILCILSIESDIETGYL